jgi:hypothetical protein
MRRSMLPRTLQRLTTALMLLATLLATARAQEGKATRREALKLPTPAAAVKERWKAAENRTWRWFERETVTDDKWRVTGITTPVHRETGEYYAGAKGYLALELVPAEMLKRGHEVYADVEDDTEPGKPSAARKARDGRPASKWLRSLDAAQLKDWLKTVDPPEAGVEGMTFWEHLTRDHGFDPAKIEGLSEDEEAKLHAAAHEGY